ncbi:TerC family protein [uncultured Maricaulis sp.]|uniref:TerC family protein n=1 Tax=uncultured Maricaulis sp. TaxID=174710 RepID=UPI0030DC4B41|tara:strand:+ start:27478 stop:28203 length:726 start_codon:yes stop_codon:yes gene_type:complete
MLEFLTSPEMWMSLATLTFLEIILGVDNVIFVALMAARLPRAKRALARTLGLGMALVFRIIMLVGLVWLAHLEADLFAVFEHGVSWRDLILLGGGLFLLTKGTLEIHHTVEGVSQAPKTGGGQAFAMIVVQITVIDIVFSLDSVITAVGMTNQVPIMITAVVIAMGVMLFASGAVSDFIESHPTTKMLALAFLLLVGMSLIADGLGFHIPRGYLYFAISFSLFVEVLNILRTRRGATSRTY